VTRDEYREAFRRALEASPLGATMESATEQVFKLDEGHGMAFRNARINEQELMDHVLPHELNNLNHMVGVTHIIGLNMRPGMPNFIFDVEHELFDPKGTVNRDLLLHIMKWKGTLWWIVTIPTHRVDAVNEVAKRFGFHLPPTVPVVMPAGKSMATASLRPERRGELKWKDALWFPVDQSTRTVETIPPKGSVNVSIHER